MPNLPVSYTDLWASEAGAPVLEPLRLTIGAGQLTLLFGANGVGKSTLLRFLAGQETHFRFAATGAAGTSLPALPLSMYGVSSWLSSAESAFFADLTVRENLAILSALHPGQGTVQDIAKRFGLLDLLSLGARVLSGGQQRRLQFAFAALSDSTVLLLDEPLANLDDDATAEVVHLIAMLKGEGRALVVVEHHRERFRGIADSTVELLGS